MQRMRIAVGGATDRAGRYVADALGRQGHEVLPIGRFIRGEGS
jgi:nucleoside-diphosphate-sugar epimerase